MLLTCKEIMLPGDTLTEKFRIALDAGFAGIDLMGGKLRDQLGEAREALLETGLAVGAVYGQLGQKGTSLIDGTAAERARTLDLFKDRMEAAVEVGADRLIFVPRFGDPELREDAAEGVLLAMLDELAEWGRSLPVTLVMEPLNRGESRFLYDPIQALAICRALGRSNVKTMIDTYHMAVEGQDMPGAIRELGPYLALVHLSDTERGLPGEGNVDFKAVAEALKRAGYAGPLGYECREANQQDLARSLVWIKRVWNGSEGGAEAG